MAIYSAPTGDFVTTSLSGVLAAGATSATIGTGLTIPAANGILVLSYDTANAIGAVDGPETISYTSYTSGTGAIAGLTRGLGGTTDVQHSNGQSVQSVLSSVLLANLPQAAERRNYTTNTTPTGQVIKTGWGYISSGAGGNPSLSATVTLPSAFTGVPILQVSCGGYCDSAPANPTGTSNAGDVIADYNALTNSQFTIILRLASGNFAASQFWIYSWIAIGV